MIKHLGISLIFLLNLNSIKAKDILFEDAFILKVVDKIYSIKELQRSYQSLQNLKCFFEDDKIAEILDLNEKLPVNQFEISKEYSEEKKRNFQKLKLLIKLITYVESQNVNIDSKLIQSLMDSYKALGCENSFINENDNTKLNKQFEQILKVHIFLKSKYLGNDQQNLNKELSGLALFIDSIDKQITDSFFWQ